MALLDVITDRQCRATLEYFCRRETDVATVDELLDAIGPWPAGGDGDAACRLHHVTLPKLADLGFLEYDARSAMVRYRARPSAASTSGRWGSGEDRRGAVDDGE